jgi:hypothetical protein
MIAVTGPRLRSRWTRPREPSHPGLTPERRPGVPSGHPPRPDHAGQRRDPRTVRAPVCRRTATAIPPPLLRLSAAGVGPWAGCWATGLLVVPPTHRLRPPTSMANSPPPHAHDVPHVDHTRDCPFYANPRGCPDAEASFGLGGVLRARIAWFAGSRRRRWCRPPPRARRATGPWMAHPITVGGAVAPGARTEAGSTLVDQDVPESGVDEVARRFVMPGRR